METQGTDKSGGEGLPDVKHIVSTSSVWGMVVHPADMTCDECGKEPKKKRGRPKKDKDEN